MKRNALIVGILILSLATFVGIGQGCGDGMKSGSGIASNAYCDGESVNVIDKDFDVQPGQSTVSIAYGRQMLDSFVSCTGVGTPSQRTLDEFDNRNQSLSEYGSLTDVSAAQMMATAAVAAEVCQDLIERERGLASAERYIFSDTNLDGNGLNQAEVISAVELLALSCWQRNSSDAEELDVVNSVNLINSNSQIGALGLCTSMLSSLSAIEQ